MKIREIKIKGKKIRVLECNSVLERARGLMFCKNPEPLLFRFAKPTRQPIHSLFCREFLAVWLLKGRIVDEKIINPFQPWITPKSRFDCLVEIPLKNSDTKFILRRKNRKV